MAVHDAVYATPAESWTQFRWRLLHLAEEGVGRRVREYEQREAAAYRRFDEMVTD